MRHPASARAYARAVITPPPAVAGAAVEPFGRVVLPFGAGGIGLAFDGAGQGVQLAPGQLDRHQGRRRDAAVAAKGHSDGGRRDMHFVVSGSPWRVEPGSAIRYVPVAACHSRNPYVAFRRPGAARAGAVWCHAAFRFGRVRIAAAGSPSK